MEVSSTLGPFLHRQLRTPATALAAFLILAALTLFYGIVPYFHHSFSVAEWAWDAWNPKNDYEHARLIPLAILFLVWRGRKELAACPLRPAALGLIPVLFGILCFIAAVRTLQPRVALFGLPFVLFGGVLYLWGWHAARKLAFPFALIFFTIPVPGLTQATNGLQLLASKVAFSLSSVLGADVVQSGNNLASSSDAWGFNVSEGCSGIRSLMALTLVAAVYSYLTQKKLWKGLVLFAASVPIAIVANALRVTTIILIAEYGDAELAGGIYHDWSGFLFFPLGLAGLILLDKALNPAGIIVRRQKTRTGGPEGDESLVSDH